MTFGPFKSGRHIQKLLYLDVNTLKLKVKICSSSTSSSFNFKSVMKVIKMKKDEKCVDIPISKDLTVYRGEQKFIMYSNHTL